MLTTRPRLLKTPLFWKYHYKQHYNQSIHHECVCVGGCMCVCMPACVCLLTDKQSQPCRLLLWLWTTLCPQVSPGMLLFARWYRLPSLSFTFVYHVWSCRGLKLIPECTWCGHRSVRHLGFLWEETYANMQTLHRKSPGRPWSFLTCENVWMLRYAGV